MRSTPAAQFRPGARTRRGATLASIALAAGLLAGTGPVIGADDSPAFPKRKPGLWEVRTAGSQASGMPPTQFCVGKDTDRSESHLDRSVGKRGVCTLGAFQRVGEAWLAESVCSRGKTSVTSRAIASGDFTSNYRIDTVVRYDPPLGGTRHTDKEAVVARRLGPCREGQNPGDIVVPGMGTLNMVDGTFRGEPPPSSQGSRAPRSRAAQ